MERREFCRSAVIAGALLFWPQLANLGRAQIVTQLVTLAQTQRQGTFISPSFNVPAGTTGVAQLVLNVAAGDFGNTANSATFAVYVFDQPTGTWRHSIGAGWRGGGDINNPDQFPVALEFDLGGLAGRTIRAEISIPNRIRVGCTLNWIH